MRDSTPGTSLLQITGRVVGMAGRLSVEAFVHPDAPALGRHEHTTGLFLTFGGQRYEQPAAAQGQRLGAGVVRAGLGELAPGQAAGGGEEVGEGVPQGGLLLENVPGERDDFLSLLVDVKKVGLNRLVFA
jgi:hypothetical protein